MFGLLVSSINRPEEFQRAVEEMSRELLPGWRSLYFCGIDEFSVLAVVAVVGDSIRAMQNLAITPQRFPMCVLD